MAPFDEVILLGDFADFYTISSHPRDLGFSIQNFLINEVDCVKKRLDEIDKFFDCKKTFIEGNHEYRLARYIRDRAPQLFGYLDCPYLFDMDKRPNWTWVPYSPSQAYRVLGSNLYARHEPIGPNAKTTAQKAMANVIHGHTHRRESSQVVALDGKNYIAHSGGWLGNKNAKSMQYVKNHHQWTLGFDIVYVCEKTKRFYITPVQIMDDYSAVVNGKIYRI